MKGHTNFTKLYAEEIVGDVISGAIGGQIDAAALRAVIIEEDDSFVLDNDHKSNLFVGIDMDAASKTVELDLNANQLLIVYNAGGTNAFTVKNITADTGTSLAKGKALLVVGSKTKDESIVIAIN